MISIGIPAYKSKYLRLAINSLLNQTFADFELIIVNSYENIKIRKIVNEFKDIRIRYFENNESLEIVENWNKVLSYSRGEFFILFSDDDTYEKTFLEEMNKLTFIYKKCDIYYCRTRQINDIGETNTYSIICPEFESGLDFLWGRIFGGRLQYAAEFMSRTNKLKKIGGFVKFPLAWGTDDVTWFLLSRNNGIAYCKKSLFNFRMSDLNISKVGNFKERLNGIDKYDKWIFEYISNYKSNSSYEIDIINHIKKNYKYEFDLKKKNLLYYSLINSNILFHTYIFFKLKRRFGLKFKWLISSYINVYFKN